MGLGEWDFCLKLLSAPTQNHSLSYLSTHTHAEYQARITSIQSTYHIFNTLNLVFYLGRIMGFYESGLLGISVIL